MTAPLVTPAADFNHRDIAQLESFMAILLRACGRSQGAWRDLGGDRSGRRNTGGGRSAIET
jgi:hypothetical protein